MTTPEKKQSLDYLPDQIPLSRPTTTSVLLNVNNMHLLVVAAVLLSAVLTVVYSQTGGAFGGGLGGYLGITNTSCCQQVLDHLNDDLAAELEKVPMDTFLIGRYYQIDQRLREFCSRFLNRETK
ncbi:uncharacterized protein LOC124118079 [Haliotis rufescens]|uniref:uncharacterized protein LOC124118079 n=1 Tax=Haliotis rufescens TaxID=6454 RepID=UPI001EAFDB6E|nr:uncharacterized protein LOC124118079 [Haliotis rufescens]